MNLNFYNDSFMKINALIDEFERVKCLGEQITSVLSDMPKAGGCSDKLSYCVIKADEISEMIKKDIDNLKEIRKKFKSMGESIQDEQLKNIFYFRYICGLKWVDVAGRMGVSVVYVQQLNKELMKMFSA